MARHMRDVPKHTGFLRRTALLLACGAVAVPPLHAELEWKTKRVTLDPPVGAREMEVAFSFVNRGATPVRILDTRSSCGCTAIVKDRESWAPGEQGTLRVRYQIASKVGHQLATITVLTDEPGSWQHDLVIEANIKAFVVFSPMAAVWKLGDEPGPRTVLVDCPEGFRLTGARSASGEFRVKAGEAIEGGRRLAVEVAPLDTFSKRQGTLLVTVVRGTEPPVEVSAVLRVF